jgi:hypothetical protein
MNTEDGNKEIKKDSNKKITFYSDYGYLEVSQNEFNNENTMISIENPKLKMYGTISVIFFF